MANLVAQANAERGTSTGFADRKVLAEQVTVFCITGVKLFTQKDGKTRWYLDIVFEDADGPVCQTLTFDQSPSRDKLFQTMIDSGDFPQHDCWLENKTFKNKTTNMTQNFYDLKQEASDKACPCGSKTIETSDVPF